MPATQPSSSPASSGRRPRGQVVVIFAGAALLFVLLCAAVIDLSWYWTNNLRMQRAADAAALAGVVYLPSNPASAYATARAEAVKNGYTDGSAGYTVTPVVDPVDNRRLKVTITGPVNTFFARVIGINSWPATQVARADFVLPVPMGSPQNYYGVGALYGTTLQTNTTPHLDNTRNSGKKVATLAPAGTPWVASSGTVITDANAVDAKYAQTKTTATTQQYSKFALDTMNAGETISGNVTGLQVLLNGVSLSAACAGANTVTVALSWNAGLNWTTVAATTANQTKTTASNYTFGVTTATTYWTGHTTWTASEISDANFRVRLTAAKPCGTAGTFIRVDQVQVQANYTTDTPTYTTSTVDDPLQRAITDPSTGAALTSQGFWGAVISAGGQRGNGDRYSPLLDGSNPNPDYDGKGYDYTIEVGALGRVSIFDPTFCATGPNTSGGSYGTGDHYIGTVGPVDTVFTLFNTNGTAYNLGDDTQVATSGALFTNEQQRDYSGNYGDAGGSDADCSGSIYHNRWWSMATSLAAGTYRLNVNTSTATGSSAENMWSLWVSGGSAPRVYGGGKMAAYTNLSAGTQLFYLAQIPAVHAGKTMYISLFDPGDVGGNAFLRIKTPDGNAYNYATFSYTADNGRSGTNVTQIQTASGGSSLFNDSVLTITIPLPAGYGTGGLTPPGETQAGWWKIEYQVGGGNDTTTWAVSIRGNPVHLVLP